MARSVPPTITGNKGGRVSRTERGIAHQMPWSSRRALRRAPEELLGVHQFSFAFDALAANRILRSAVSLT